MKRYLAPALAVAVLATVGAANGLARNAAAPYLGTWAARLSQAEMINEGFDPRLAGTFRLVLRPNGTYTSFNSFDGASRGRFRATGSRIAFFADVGCKAGGFDGRAVYTWSLVHGRLRLASVTLGGDVCGGRWQTLTYPLWKRIK